MRITAPRVSWHGVLAIAALALYLVGKMFYVAGQGGAQPADIAMAGAFLLLITPRAVVRLFGVNAFLPLLMGWAVLVNLGWALATADGEFLTPMSYYVFNLGIVLAVFWTRQKNPRLFDIVIAVAVVLALAWQMFAVSSFSGGHRSEGTFENPNQLAFWALSCMGIWMLVRRGRFSPLDIAVVSGLLWIELNSLSRAGLAASGLLVAIWLFRSMRTLRMRLIVLGSAAFIAGLLALTPAVSERLAESDMVARVEARINRQARMSEFQYRGYDRILEFTGQIVIGAGEGAVGRFADYDREIEIHSTFGTLLFSYGILGIVLFLAFLWRTTRTLALDRYIYLAPSLAYGFTHNGLRFSFFWFMVGILLSFAVTEGRKAAAMRRPVMRPAGPNFDHQAAPVRGPVGGR